MAVSLGGWTVCEGPDLAELPLLVLFLLLLLELDEHLVHAWHAREKRSGSTKLSTPNGADPR